MDKFKKGDKVVKVGTKIPIMEIRGKLVKANLPNYKETEDIYTCKWTTLYIFNHNEDFKESELELFVDTKEV